MKRKIFSVLFALVLAVSLSLVTAVPVAANGDPTTLNVLPFTLDEGVAWSTEQAPTGSHSVKLVADGDYVEFTPFPGTTLGDLSAITTGWSWLYNSDGIGPGLELRFAGPNFDTVFEHIDITVNTAELSPVGTQVWTNEPVTSTSTATCYGNDSTGTEFADSFAPGEAWVCSTGNNPLADIVSIVTGYTGLEDAGDWPLTRVRAEIYASGTVYIDDIEIAGTTYYGLIQDAVDTASADDTILVADGTYEESISVTTDNLTLRSENGRDSTIIENVGGTTFPEVSQSGFLIRGPANDFTLGGAADQGFTFSGGTAPRLIQLNNGPSGVTISHNTVDTTGTATIGIQQGAAVTTGLTVSYNTFTSGAGSIPLTGPNLVNVTVTYNNFSGVWDPEDPETDIYTPAIFFTGVTGTSSTISNNTITLHGRGILLENGTGTSDLLISGNNINNSYVGIKFDQSVGADMTTVTVTENTLSTNYKGIHVVNGANVKASYFTIEYNNISGSTTDGLLNEHATEIVTAENNWWGNASGANYTNALYDIAYGDIVSANVDYEPWLLAVVVSGTTPTTYDKTLALKDEWTLVSPDKEVTTGTTWVGTTVLSGTDTILAYKYTPGTGFPQVTMATQLTSVDAFYLKTDGGGGVGINYSTSSPGVVTKTLSAGWNVISCAGETDAYTILSQLRHVQIGEQEGTGLTSLVGQGSYNQFTNSISETLVTDAEWLAITPNYTQLPLSAFDGFWVYMNAGKSFGVIPD